MAHAHFGMSTCKKKKNKMKYIWKINELEKMKYEENEREKRDGARTPCERLNQLRKAMCIKRLNN